MKRPVSIFIAVLILVFASVCSAGADILTEAAFDDGFSDDSGKLSITVTNDSQSETLTDVTVSLTLPDGVSTGSFSANLGELSPGESAAKDFMLSFEARSVFARYKYIFIFGGVSFALLFAIGFSLLRRSKRGTALVLALALLPAAAFSSRALMMRRQAFTLTHDGEEYSVSILVTAEKDESAEMTFGQNGDSALSRPLKSTRPTNPYEDYNTPKVARGRIKEGAGPLGDSEIYVGTDGMMFFGEEIDYFTGKSLLDEKTLAHIADKLAAIDEWARRNGIDFYFMICPNKSTVYADLLPESVTGAEATNRTLLVERLKDTSVRVVDATDAVIAARREFGDGLYFKYDTHWNQHGGYAAYAELMRVIRADSPSAKLYGADMFNVSEYEAYMKDNAYYLGYYDAFTDFGPVYSLKVGPEAEMTEHSDNESHGQFRFCNHWETGFREDLSYVCFESVNPDAPAAYMLRDSFSIGMLPFLKESFSTSAFDWAFNCRADEILSRGTKVLILEVVERSIGELSGARIYE